MTSYDILVDGKPQARVGTEDAVRAWLRQYRDEHDEDDPAAAHVQLLERGRTAWLTGGRLVSRERFLT